MVAGTLPPVRRREYAPRRLERLGSALPATNASPLRADALPGAPLASARAG